MIFTRSHVRRAVLTAAACCTIFAATGRAAHSAGPDTINVGRAIVTAFAFSVYEIGEEAKLCRAGGGRQRQTPAGCPGRAAA